MAQIRVFEKSLIDLSIDNVAITITDAVATNTGEDFVNLLRNRSNDDGWATTGSTDAANTVLEADLISEQLVSNILLVGHNFKDYVVDYWDGIQWVNIETVTGSVETTSYIHFSGLDVYKVRLTINATQAADDDKFMSQLIICDDLSTGQFEGFPEIKNLKHGTNKRRTTMLSGKTLVVEGTGATSFGLDYKVTTNDNDLTLLESMYGSKQGFLISLSGGDEDQFSTKRIGYRKKDIYFVRMLDDYSDDFYKSLYSSGNKIKTKLGEAVL